MENDFNGVANTSLFTAALRAVETHRSDAEGRLFSDPYAEILAGQTGKALLQKALEVSGPQPAIAIRTAFIDEKFQEALNSGLQQVVVLAAGMDTRAYRFPFAKQTTLFELDQPVVLNYKKIKLSEVKPLCHRIEVPVDLRNDWPETLKEAGFKFSQQTLWTAEGLSMYLEESQVVELFKKLNSLASPGDVLLADIMSRDLLEAPPMRKQLDFLASLGAPWKFGTNDPEGFMEKLGWTATAIQPGEYAPQRWPFPTVPRHVPNVPRSFFVRAQKG